MTKIESIGHKREEGTVPSLPTVQSPLGFVIQVFKVAFPLPESLLDERLQVLVEGVDAELVGNLDFLVRDGSQVGVVHAHHDYRP